MVQSCILKKLSDHLFLIGTTGIHPHPNIEQIRGQKRNWKLAANYVILNPISSSSITAKPIGGRNPSLRGQVQI